MALKIDPAVNATLAGAGANRERVAPSGARESKSAPSATDFHQFAALRRAADAHDPKALREVARQFESIFTKMMLDSMRSASFGDPMFGSDQVEQYQGMMDDQLAVQLSQGKGLGLADMLVRQLQGGAAGAAAATTGDDTANNVTPQQRQDFVDKLLPHATAAARELGVDPRSIIAQAALETGWGTHLPADAQGNNSATSNNYFGIKAGGAWNGSSVTAGTTEFTGGVAGSEQARFRSYGSVAENLADYVRVLREPRYSAALGTGADVRSFADALQRGGYATDPDYANKLVSIAERIPVRRSIAANERPNVNGFKSDAAAPIPPQELTNG